MRDFLAMAMCFKCLKSATLLAILIVLVGCQSPFAAEVPPIPIEAAVSATAPAAALDVSPTPLPPTASITPLPERPTAIPKPTTTSTPADLAITIENVQLYPVPFIVTGDRVTFQVQPHVPENVAVTDVSVDIYVDEQLIVSDTLSERNWAGQGEGIFQWAWDSAGHFGDHTIRVVLDAQDRIQIGDENGENNEVTLSTKVRKAGERPLEERDASWVTAETDCCSVHILTGTAAYRDLPELLGAIEQAVSQAAIALQEEPDKKLDVFFIDRTIGQGGFAGTTMTVSYVDRPYAGGNLHELLVHEAVHVIDRQFAPQRIKFLAEGVAVWASGGHYKAEDIDRRAAALLHSGRYIPLAELINNFYPAQHEIGYLQAGAFVTYLVDQFGWSTFREFYSDTAANDADSEFESMDQNLRSYYGSTLAQMEAEWLDYLLSLAPDDREIADLETTIRYYEMMRRYQKAYDPTAHFLRAWLPNPLEVQEEGNTVDLTRHPQAEINITLEVMLQNAEQALLEGDYVLANVLLDSIGRILDENGAFSDPLSSSYQAIVQITTAFGYQVQDIDLEGDAATALATTASGIHLSELRLERKRGDWILLRN